MERGEGGSGKEGSLIEGRGRSEEFVVVGGGRLDCSLLVPCRQLFSSYFAN